MKKTPPLALLCLFIIAAVFDSQAVETRGAPSCGAWIKQKGTLQGSGSKGWLVGFLTGVAVESDKDLLAGTDSDSLFLWVDRLPAILILADPCLVSVGASVAETWATADL